MKNIMLWKMIHTNEWKILWTKQVSQLIKRNLFIPLASDDYQFVSFIFGAAQLTKGKLVKGCVSL